MSPAVSEQQRRLACIALSIKLGKTDKSFSKEGAKMAETMSEETLREFCESKVRK
ncbi:hypothetical protein LCGC14_0430840 [marine sediment metagenome]|uniref:Uncharacterized protein n=1 Tax=marine sediment metagenome TaxID=412755 RepID=A0A0F9SU74_9ZZZZ